eukprot:scaffold105581_cov25-Prasinocladus_malaysianus.AAC.1
MAELVGRRCMDKFNTVPLIVSRGYLGGDESRLLHQRLKGTPAVVVAGSDRATVARQASPDAIYKTLTNIHMLSPTIILRSSPTFMQFFAMHIAQSLWKCDVTFTSDTYLMY